MGARLDYRAVWEIVKFKEVVGTIVRELKKCRNGQTMRGNAVVVEVTEVGVGMTKDMETEMIELEILTGIGNAKLIIGTHPVCRQAPLARPADRGDEAA